MNPLESVNHPLSGVCQRWLNLIEDAKKAKNEVFGKYAAEATKFFDSDHNFMWKDEYATQQGGYFSEDSFGAKGFPTFRVCVNKVFESVALFGPALYHKNPNIQVTAKLPPELTPEDLGISQDVPPEMMQAIQAKLQEQSLKHTIDKTIAKLLQHYLNWLQLESDKKTQSRRAINESIVKGMGILWTEMYQPPNSKMRYPRSVYVSCDDIVKDPDARYREEVQWIARRCVHPVNLVEEKYGFKKGELRGTMQSIKSQGTARSKNDKKNGKIDSKSFDLIEYWEIYSKNGIGQNIKTHKEDKRDDGVKLSDYGQYCYLVVCDGMPFPLNIKDQDADPSTAAMWPIPFWEDEGCNNGWPCTELGYYESPDHIWPIPLIKPAIGEIRFVNWCFSFLADKVAVSCKNYLAVAKQAMEEFRQQSAGQYGPFAILELSHNSGEDINKIITWLQPPPFDENIWKMLSEVLELIDKRTGLTELIYGLSGRQMRSAEEARVKNENTTIRPDDMASRVEDWLSDVAMKEMEAAVWSLDEEDYVPVVGSFGTEVLKSTLFQDGDFYEKIVRNYSFRIEAGSAKKPNKAAKIEQLNTLGQAAISTMQAFAMGGQVGPWNAYIYDLAEAMDLPDPQRYTLQQVPQEPGTDPQAELDVKQQELQMKQEAEQAKLEMQKEKTGMEIQAKQMEIQLKAKEAEQQMALKQAEFAQEAQMQQQQFSQESQINAQKHSQEMEISQANATQDMRLKEQQAQQGVVQSMAKNKIAVEESRVKQQTMKETAKAKAKASTKPKPKKKP